MSALRTETIDCCVVGGGPAGAILALMLARQGVDVMLLEANSNFDRQFRGDTLHPAVMEALDAIGLAQAVLRLPHSRVDRFVMSTGVDEAIFAEFSELRTRFPYIVMMPQASLLELLVTEARRYPNFRLKMNARVEGLLEDPTTADSAVPKVCGVRYREPNGETVEVRATLTVGADGRFSAVRRLSGLEVAMSDHRKQSMDVLWFRLPSQENDPPNSGATFRFGAPGLLVLMRHAEGWQAGLILGKGGYPKLKSAGLDVLRKSLSILAPDFATRIQALNDWHQTSVLSVVSGCLPRWFRPGLLLIGDAAHPTSPIGGVGINLAVQDALETARRLAGQLKLGTLEERDLSAVQGARRNSTLMIHAFQGWAQRWVVARALGPKSARQTSNRLPWWLCVVLRIPKIRQIPGGLIAFAARPKAQIPIRVQPQPICVGASELPTSRKLR
jgi:2-polyprenyl-6-methoxyphenol hydroxylase-like FAD-dependent oxidoreductase